MFYENITVTHKTFNNKKHFRSRYSLSSRLLVSNLREFVISLLRPIYSVNRLFILVIRFSPVRKYTDLLEKEMISLLDLFQQTCTYMVCVYVRCRSLQIRLRSVAVEVYYEGPSLRITSSTYITLMIMSGRDELSDLIPRSSVTMRTSVFSMVL